MSDLQDELGDLLLQVVYHAQMAEEAGLFSFADVAEGISDKMIARGARMPRPLTGLHLVCLP